MLGVIIGTFAAKVVSIPGIGGLIAGLFIKRRSVVVGVGVALGVLDSVILLYSSVFGPRLLSWIMAIIVGLLATALGWWIRGRKRP